MKDLARAWLATHCALAPGVSRAVLFYGEPDRGPFGALACWPDGAGDTPALREAGQLAMAERRCVIVPPGRDPEAAGGCDALALPLVIEGQLRGGVACEVPHRPKAQQEALLERLLWSCAWLELLLRQHARPAADRPAAVLELLATCLESTRLQAACTALATALAHALALDRVSLGFLRGGHVALCALSHSARFDEKSELVRRIEAAMEEALDQHATLAHPPLAGAHAATTRAHEALAREPTGHAVCSVPLVAAGRLVGAITLERGASQPLGAADVALCEQLAALAGPFLELRRREERWIGAKLADSLRTALAELIGPKRLVAKLAAAVLVTALLVLALVKGDYRVTADATLEGTTRRVVAAAMDGFLVEEHARAGDVVREGQLLAAMDERDLRLERVRWASERNRAWTEHREAQALRDWSGVAILSAEVAEADAQLALIDEQIARTRLVAPFDGVVVRGDLSQSLGSPVERGEVFFEIAPLDSYRVMLEVDERSVEDVRREQRGRLALSSMPEQPLALTVERITPIASTESGRNRFHVEARLDEPPDGLRPGMEGVAKLDVDRRPLLWISTHELVDRLRLGLWRLGL